MSKYIIKNCPAFMKPRYCKDKCSYSIINNQDGELTYKFEFDENSKCQDCTDCVLKQIVENLRQVAYACHCDNCDGCGYYSGCDDTECGTYQALESLELLDIQEVE